MTTDQTEVHAAVAAAARAAHAAVADLAIALMVMTARRLVASDRHVRSGGWAI